MEWELLRKLVLRPPVLPYGEWGADDEGPPPYPGKRTAAGCILCCSYWSRTDLSKSSHNSLARFTSTGSGPLS